MKWPWDKPRVLATDRLIRCPECKSTRPKTGFQKLWQNVIRDGRIVTFEDGGILRCEECGCVFCFDVEGTYLPTVSRGQQQKPPDKQEQEPPALPIPRPRPKV